MTDLAEALPKFCDRRIYPEGFHDMTPPAQTQTKAPKQKRRDCLNVTVKVQIPITDRASMDAAYEARDGAGAAESWPADSVIAVTSCLGKM
jgi:hypothetical protein